MPAYLIPILLSGSLLLTASCSRLPYAALSQEARSSCVQDLKPDFSVIRYRAQVEIAGRGFGGTLIFKKMSDQSLRAVFTGDAGITFFDLGFKSDGFTVYYMHEQLNRKAVIRQLQQDISLILMTEVQKEALRTLRQSGERIHLYGTEQNTAAYITPTDCSRLLRAERWKKGKLNARAQLFAIQNNIADSVFIDHRSFNFTISLRQINQP